MSVAIAVSNASPVHGKDVVRFNVTGATGNDSGAYDVTKYPTEPELRYYLAYAVGGAEKGRSQVFGVTPDGSFEINNYIFPSSGSWSVTLRNVADDTVAATLSVTVS